MIRKSLKAKLIISYLAVALLTVLVVSVFIRFTSGKQFLNLVAEQQASLLKDEAVYYFVDNGNLDGFFDYYLSSLVLDPNADPGIDPRQKPPGFFPREIRGKHGLVDLNFKAIIPFLNYQIGQVVNEKDRKDLIAVNVDGKTIAWIIPDKSIAFKYSAEEQVFLKRVNQAILYAALAGIIGAILMGIILAAFFLKPIHNLILASKKMAEGDLQQTVPVQSLDELGQLSTTFNQMSSDLAASDRQRRQLTADITHDLSTPLQVISGYVEMLEDGEITLSHQQIQMINGEIELLRRLVNDLSMLSQADAKDLQMQIVQVDPNVLFERAYHAFVDLAKKENKTIEYRPINNVPMIRVDEGRMFQVIGNLIDNAMRYTPTDGRIVLSVLYENDQVELRISDSGSGINPEDLPYVFDRFYRADKARDGNSGKMGLGLAISKALVLAQGGTIHVESPVGGQGTTFVIRFRPDSHN